MTLSSIVLERLSDLEAQPFHGGRYASPDRIYTAEGLLDTTDILPPLDSPPRNVIPTNPVNHVADLCICQHSRLQHYSILGNPQGKPLTLADLPKGPVTGACTGTRHDTGEPCRCTGMNPVSQKLSKHAFHRGQKLLKRSLSSLYPGDQVLAGWTTVHGKIRLTDNQKQGALVATVTAKPRPYKSDAEAGGQSWRDRAVVVATDLGETVPQTGGTPVYVVR